MTSLDKKEENTRGVGFREEAWQFIPRTRGKVFTGTDGGHLANKMAAERRFS